MSEHINLSQVDGGDYLRTCSCVLGIRVRGCQSGALFNEDAVAGADQGLDCFWNYGHPGFGCRFSGCSYGDHTPHHIAQSPVQDGTLAITEARFREFHPAGVPDLYASIMSANDNDLPAPAPREILSWSLFGDAARELAQRVVDSGWHPDVVVAVARGGLLPAGAVSYALGVKAMGTMNVEFYTGIAQTLTQPVFLPPLMDTATLAGKKVLVVDDVADSGRTLTLVLETLQRMSGVQPAEVRSAVLYVKPASQEQPDYVWRTTEKWITFPWSALPTVEPQRRKLP